MYYSLVAEIAHKNANNRLCKKMLLPPLSIFLLLILNINLILSRCTLEYIIACKSPIKPFSNNLPLSQI